MKQAIIYISILIILSLSSSASGDVSEDLPVLKTKTSITSLRIGMNYLDNRTKADLMPSSFPMPLMDPDYFSFGDWAFYADNYFNKLLKPYLNGDSCNLDLKPLELRSRQKPTVQSNLINNAALVRVEYPRHEELERLLQKLYFNLIRGPILLSIAYDPRDIQDGYKHFGNWRCFQSSKDPTAGEDGDVHIVYVDWDKIHSVVAFLDGGSIKVADKGRIYEVDHNAIIAQANAIMALPNSRIIDEKADELNFLLFMKDQQIASLYE